MKIIRTCLASLMVIALAVPAVVAAPESAPMATAGGQITSIDAAAKSLVVKVNDPTAPPHDLSFVVADDAKIIRNGTAIALSELKQGDKVTITHHAQDGKNVVVNMGTESKT